MRQFFHKSSILMLFLASIAFIISLGFAVVNAGLLQNQLLPSYMSKLTIRISVNQREAQGFSNNDLCDWVLSTKEDMTFYKHHQVIDGKELFTTKIMTIGMPLVFGRELTETELSGDHANALIGVELLQDCLKKDDAYYYSNKNEYAYPFKSV